MNQQPLIDDIGDQLSFPHKFTAVVAYKRGDLVRTLLHGLAVGDRVSSENFKGPLNLAICMRDTKLFGIMMEHLRSHT